MTIQPSAPILTAEDLQMAAYRNPAHALEDAIRTIEETTNLLPLLAPHFAQLNPETQTNLLVPLINQMSYPTFADAMRISRFPQGFRSPNEISDALALVHNLANQMPEEDQQNLAFITANNLSPNARNELTESLNPQPSKIGQLPLMFFATVAGAAATKLFSLPKSPLAARCALVSSLIPLGIYAALGQKRTNAMFLAIPKRIKGAVQTTKTFCTNHKQTLYKTAKIAGGILAIAGIIYGAYKGATFIQNTIKEGKELRSQLSNTLATQEALQTHISEEVINSLLLIDPAEVAPLPTITEIIPELIIPEPKTSYHEWMALDERMMVQGSEILQDGTTPFVDLYYEHKESKTRQFEEAKPFLRTMFKSAGLVLDKLSRISFRVSNAMEPSANIHGLLS